MLEWCYSRANLRPPPLTRLRRKSVPQPYRKLLVHSEDMTPTLERFFRQRLGLAVLGRECESDVYRREVLLTVENGSCPVLYGAIRIFLDRLPPNARRRVEDELYPLGRVLQMEAVPHLSWPRDFFLVEADRHLATRLKVSPCVRLFGRRNVLLDGARRWLAEVIEVLAPVPGHSHDRLGVGPREF